MSAKNKKLSAKQKERILYELQRMQTKDRESWKPAWLRGPSKDYFEKKRKEAREHLKKRQRDLATYETNLKLKENWKHLKRRKK